MKIAFVSQPGDIIDPPNLESSIAIWTYEVARRLASSDDIIVYAKYPKKGWLKEKYDEGVSYRYISIALDERLIKLLKSLERLGIKFKSKRPLFSSSLFYLGYGLQIAKDLRGQQCDIVHIFNSSQFVPIIRSFNPKIKIVLHMHCQWLNQLERTMLQKRLEQADLIIGCSEYITEQIRQRFPEFAERYQTVYNGVDIKKFSNKNELKAKENQTKQLLFVGRVSPEKGIHILLEAFAKVVKSYPETHLKIVGFTQLIPYEFIVALSDDPKVTKLASFYPNRWLSYLDHWQNDSTIAKNISFIGSVSNSEVINYYQNTDIFVFPSVVNEAFGIPIIEAMATGVPVVVSRSGAFEEVVDEGKTGLIVERDDADALAEAILQLLADEDKRKAMAKVTRERVAALFTYDKVVENLLYQYKNLCRSQQINVTSERT